MKPEATAVMMIEGGDTCYLGHLIPTTMGLENKLHNCMDNVTKPLVDVRSVLIPSVLAPTVLAPDLFVI